MVYDSFVYRQPYRIVGIEDVPADFQDAFSAAEKLSPQPLEAFFVPRGEGEGFFHSFIGAPRIFRTTPLELQVMFHPALGQPCSLDRFAMGQILFHEVGNSLLRSWFGLTVTRETTAKQFIYPFATRWEDYFKRLVKTLNRQLMMKEESIAGPPIISDRWIEEMDPPFAAAVRECVSTGEELFSLVLEPPRYDGSGYLRKVRRSGRCFVLTGRQLLWLDEDSEGRHLEFGLVCRQIPIARIGSISLSTFSEQDKLRSDLTLRLRAHGGECTLVIPIDPDFHFYYFQLIETWKGMFRPVVV